MYLWLCCSQKRSANANAEIPHGIELHQLIEVPTSSVERAQHLKILIQGDSSDSVDFAK